jgi:hypothetical protein
MIIKDLSNLIQQQKHNFIMAKKLRKILCLFNATFSSSPKFLVTL